MPDSKEAAMNNEIAELINTITKLEEERNDLEGMFTKVRPSKPDTLSGEKYLFMKYAEHHRERLIDIKLEIAEKKAKLTKLRKK